MLYSRTTLLKVPELLDTVHGLIAQHTFGLRQIINGWLIVRASQEHPITAFGLKASFNELSHIAVTDPEFEPDISFIRSMVRIGLRHTNQFFGIWSHI